ncbi:MAG: tetratricopeptide repeat protein [bacterium]|nr:tetratricopeptide repeat protein [bacterium]
MAVIPQEVIDKVNNKLTAELVIEKIGVNLATCNIEGQTIKCFCPIHKESIFRSLSIYKDQLRFKCAYTLCPGNKGGTLLDLYCFSTKQPLATAILFWAKELKIEGQLPATDELIADAIARAESLVSAGKRETAIQEFQALLDFAPTNWSLWQRILDLYKETGLIDIAVERAFYAAKLADEKKNRKQAMVFLTQLIEWNPTHLLGNELLAELYLDEKQTEKATELWKKILPVYIEQKEYQSALQIIEKLIDLYPDLTEYKLQGAELYAQVGQTDQAIHVLEKLLTQYQYQANFEETIKVLTRLTELAPTEIKWQKQLAEAYIATDQTQKAVGILQQLADRFAKQNKIAEALQVLNQAFLADPENLSLVEQRIELLLATNQIHDAAPLMEYLAEQYLQKNELDKVAGIYQRQIALVPQDTDLRYKLIDVYIKLGKKELAFEQYQQLVNLYLAENEPTSAVEIYQAMLKLSPDDIAIHTALAELYQKLEKYKEAIQEYLEMGTLLEAKREFNQAIEKYNQIIAIDSDHIGVREKLITIYTQLKQPDKIREMKLALAQIYQKKNEIAKAIALAQEILADEPKHIPTLSLLLECYQSQNKLTEVAAIYDKLAQAYVDIKDINKAANMYRRELEITPNKPEVLLSLAELLTELRAISEAKKIYTQLGGIFEQKRDFKRAIETYEYILKLDPNDLTTAETLVKLEATHAGNYPTLMPVKQRVSHMLQLAKIYLQKNLFSEAEALAEQIVSLAPDEESVYRLLADTYQKTGRKDTALQILLKLVDVLLAQKKLDSAIDELQHILQIEPNHLETRKKLVAAYLNTKNYQEAGNHLHIIAEQYRSAQDLPNAIAAYEQQLKLFPENTEIITNLAQLYTETQQINSAINLYTQLANIYTKQGETEKIGEILRTIVSLDPENPERREKLGQFYLKSGMIHEALLEYDALATLFAQQNKFDDAIRIFLTMLNIDPNNLQIRVVIAEMYERRGAYSEAIAQYMAIAQAYLQSGDTDKSIAIYQRAIALDPENTMLLETVANLHKTTKKKSSAIEIYQKLAKTYFEKDKINKAKEIYETILELEPENVESHSNLIKIALMQGRKSDAVKYSQALGTIFYKRKAIPEAITAYQEAIKFDPENVALRKEFIDLLLNTKKNTEAVAQYQELAKLYAQQGKPTDAVNAYRAAIKLDPENVALYLGLIDTHLQEGLELELVDDYLAIADLYVKKGETQTAKEYYEKVLQLEPNNRTATKQLRKLG